MSTPMSVDTPPASAQRRRLSTNELQAQMQHMIELQYEQQRFYEQQQQLATVPFVPGRSSHATRQQESKSNQAIIEGGPAAVAEKFGDEPVLKRELSSMTPEFPDQDLVGKGTLIFPSGGDIVHKQLTPPPPPAHLPPSLLNLTRSAPRLNLYGSVEPPKQEEDDLEVQQHIQHGLCENPPPPPTVIHQQHHDYQYGNPDYHDPYLNRQYLENEDEHSPHDLHDVEHHEYSHRKHSTCCCLWGPFSDALIAFYHAESLHRSFCYGAIDGMLTGCGIVAALTGLKVLSFTAATTTTALQQQYSFLFAIALSTAACFADSVCMALGHVWTAHILTTSQARERSELRRELQQHPEAKANAKGRLVDMLLAKGMLKIDAMSLADTLEGYPDLFISTLAGESLLHAEPGCGLEDDWTTESGRHMIPRTAFPSYGRLTDMEMDPEAHAINTTMTEARRESMFMMVGFTVFAVLPSVTSLVLRPQQQQNADPHQAILHPSSLLVTCACCVMWCLGVWKSRFLDSNWLIYGIEAVLVLLVCLAAAYGIGALVKATLLEHVVIKIVAAPASLTSSSSMTMIPTGH